MFDPESLMFQTDWKPLEDWFRRRAQAAVDRGEISNIYQYTETISRPSALSEETAGSAYELGFAAGKFIANLLDKAS